MNIIVKSLEKYKKLPVQAKASLWFVFCSVLQRGISFITVPIFTRMMSTEQYGNYSTYVSWYSVLIVFTSLNLYYGVFNNAMVKFEDKRDKYIASMQGLVTTITFLFFIAYLILRDYLNDLLGMTTPIVLLLFVELLVTPSLQFWTVRNRFEYRYKVIVIVTLLKSLLNPLLGIAFVLLTEEKDIARIVSTVLVELIICGVIAIYQFYKGKSFFEQKYWKYAVLFNLPLIPHYLSGTILNQGDRIMISKLAGASEVALYSVAYNLGQLMNMFIMAINGSFTPWIYRELKENRTKNIAQVVNLLLVLMGGLVFCLMFLAPEVLNIIAGKEYADAVYVIPPVAASVYFVFLYNIFSNVEFYYEERKYVTIGSILAACINLILNGIFIPKFGYYAAGYTTLFCYIIYGLSHIYFTRVVAKKHLNSAKLFDDVFILGFSLMLVIITVLQNVLYSYTIVRYVLIGGVIIVVLVKRKTIIGELEKMRASKKKM